MIRDCARVKLQAEGCPLTHASRSSCKKPICEGCFPAVPWGTLSGGGGSQRGLKGLQSFSLSVVTFPLFQPVPSQDGHSGVWLCRGGPCLWSFLPYLVRELHATFLAPPGASKRRPGAEGGEVGTRTHAGLGSAAAPCPRHCPSCHPPKAPRGRRCSPGQRDRDRLPHGGFPLPPLCWPQTLSLQVDALSPAALSQHGAPIRAGRCLPGWDGPVGPQSWRDRRVAGDGACPGVPLTSAVLIWGDLEKGNLICSRVIG